MFDLDRLEALPASLARGVAAAIGVALAGGAVWAIVGRLTGWQIGYLAIGLGYAVGVTMGKVGRSTDSSGAVAAAAVAFGGSLVGHLAWVYTGAAAELHVSTMDIVAAKGPIDVLTDTGITEPFSWVFFLLAAAAGYRGFSAVAEELAAAARRPVAGFPPPQHNVGVPPQQYAPQQWAPQQYAAAAQSYAPQQWAPQQQAPQQSVPQQQQQAPQQWAPQQHAPQQATPQYPPPQYAPPQNPPAVQSAGVPAAAAPAETVATTWPPPNW